MNILITSAGRRGYLVKYFKEALIGKVYVGNSDKCAPSFCYADESVVTPLIYDKEYVSFLISFCREKNIEVIIPVFDVDLWVLAKQKAEFLKWGIKVIVSSTDFIEVCNDKWHTYKFCIENGILTCRSFLNVEEVKKLVDEGELKFPLIIKPRWGMGSLGIYEAENLKELEVLYQMCKKNIQRTYLKYEAAIDIEHCVIIQEKISGQEYGMDIFNDLDGNFMCSVVRKKLGMRAGETDIAIIEKNSDLNVFAEKLSNLTRHIANLDMDIFVSDKDIYLLEMNARFGGGYPFGHLSGVNFPKAIIKMIEGQKVDDECVIKRYGQIIQKDIGFVVY